LVLAPFFAIERFVKEHFEISLVAESAFRGQIAGAGEILLGNANGDVPGGRGCFR
jgi:hypothetical protein